MVMGLCWRPVPKRRHSAALSAQAPLSRTRPLVPSAHLSHTHIAQTRQRGGGLGGRATCSTTWCWALLDPSHHHNSSMAHVKSSPFHNRMWQRNRVSELRNPSRRSAGTNKATHAPRSGRYAGARGTLLHLSGLSSGKTSPRNGSIMASWPLRHEDIEQRIFGTSHRMAHGAPTPPCDGVWRASSLAASSWQGCGCSRGGPSLWPLRRWEHEAAAGGAPARELEGGGASLSARL